jgi:hypothetical protein
VLQTFFTNQNLIYILYPVEEEKLLIITIIRLLFHFYPPFLFAKCYLDISKVASMHFDIATLMWVEGKYYQLSDIFYEYEGNLRIGIKYSIDSYASTMTWFVAVSVFYLTLIVLIEINNNIKGGSLANPKTWWRIVKESLRSLNLKRMNVKRLQIENSMNKYFEKFLKVEDTTHPGNCEPNTSFVIKEGKYEILKPYR